MLDRTLFYIEADGFRARPPPSLVSRDPSGTVVGFERSGPTVKERCWAGTTSAVIDLGSSLRMQRVRRSLDVLYALIRRLNGKGTISGVTCRASRVRTQLPS